MTAGDIQLASAAGSVIPWWLTLIAQLAILVVSLWYRLRLRRGPSPPAESAHWIQLCIDWPDPPGTRPGSGLHERLAPAGA